MPAFGGISFFSVSGPVEFPSEQPEVITRPNVDGIAIRLTGRRARSSEIVCKVDLLNASAVLSANAAYKALVGFTVSWTDDLGTTYSGYLCLDAVVQKPQPVIQGVGGLLTDTTAQFFQTVIFTVQYPFAS